MAKNAAKIFHGGPRHPEDIFTVGHTEDMEGADLQMSKREMCLQNRRIVSCLYRITSSCI